MISGSSDPKGQRLPKLRSFGGKRLTCDTHDLRHLWHDGARLPGESLEPGRTEQSCDVRTA